MIERWLTQDVTRIRKTGGEANSIGGVKNPTTSTLGLKGRIRPLKAGEELSADKEIAKSTHVLYCLPADIMEQDTIVCGNDTYRVKGIINPMNLNRFYQVGLELSGHGI